MIFGSNIKSPDEDLDFEKNYQPSAIFNTLTELGYD